MSVLDAGAAWIAAGLAMLSVSPAPAAAAAPLANGKGFDAGLLAGKICQGTFNTGRRREASEGAIEPRFAVEGDRLTAQFSRLVALRCR